MTDVLQTENHSFEGAAADSNSGRLLAQIQLLSSFVFKSFFLLFWTFSIWAMPLLDHLRDRGYVELGDKKQEPATFDALYASFDELIAFLKENPTWANKLYSAKERFIRSKDKSYYSTDFFGYYDESERVGRSQISFYYSTHFHEFIFSRYPELAQVEEISRFFAYCLEIQKPYGYLFERAALELNISPIFISSCPHTPLLFKVVKYLPDYTPTKPHYDGTAFSLFLDSTDNESLLLSPYKSSFTIDDFSPPLRELPPRSSILLIPGSLLTEFSIYPRP